MKKRLEMDPDYPFTDSRVAKVFTAIPLEIRQRLLTLRQWILKLGKHIDSIGQVEESLKWGEPSYTTISGSPVRLGWKAKDPETFALYFHCQSKLVETFRQRYPTTFAYQGNRAIVFQKNDPIPEAELKDCLTLALTYHRWKNKIH